MENVKCKDCIFYAGKMEYNIYGKCHIPILKYMSWMSGCNIYNMYEDFNMLMDDMDKYLKQTGSKMVLYSNVYEDTEFYYIDTKNSIWTQFYDKAIRFKSVNNDLNYFINNICAPFYVECDCNNTYFNIFNDCELYTNDNDLIKEKTENSNSIITPDRTDCFVKSNESWQN